MKRFASLATGALLVASCSLLNAPDDVSPASSDTSTSSSSSGGGDSAGGGGASSTTTTTSQGPGGSGGGTGGDGGQGGAPPPECQNGVVEEGEECDDGNALAGDACSAECKITEFDVEADPTVGNEWPGIGLSKAAGDNSFFVVWRFLGTTGDEIRGRAYTDTGARVTQSPVKISTTTSPGQARIGTNHLGRSIVAWQGFADNSDVKFRVIEPDGTALDVADDILVGSAAQSLISVGASATGELSLMWMGNNLFGGGYTANVWPFDANGKSAATAPVTLGTTFNFGYPGIWGVDDGFVASYNTDDGKLGSYHLDNVATPIGSGFTLASNINANNNPFGAYVGPNSEFVAVFEQQIDLGGVVKSRISMRPFTAPGNSQVLESLVSSQHRYEYQSRVAQYSNGRFVVVWSDQDIDANDPTSSCNIVARVFEANGTPVATEFVVNQSTAGCQSWPGVAVNALGDAMFVWDNNETFPYRISSVLIPRLLSK